MLHALLAGISVVNLFDRPAREGDVNRSVSVCIPARNEEHNLPALLLSLENQTHLPDEILVLDDHSSDRTAQIIKKSSATYLKAKALPEGWTGKNWACHQLSQKASGEVLIFLDADVTLADDAIDTMLHRHVTGLSSVFPKQVTQSFGERLIVPMMNWLVLSFLPLFLVRTKYEKFVAAIGQCMIIDSDSYERIGGHEEIKGDVVDDLALARNAKKHEVSLSAWFSSCVRTRMYRSLQESVDGFAKNFFSATRIPAWVFVPLVIVVPLWLLIELFLPFGFVFALINRVCVWAKGSEDSLLNVVLYPFSLIALLITGIVSVVRTKRGERSWKGRQY